MKGQHSEGAKKEKIMNATNHGFSRRGFIKTATAAGAASIIGALSNRVTASQHQAFMPTRPFGKTGINVPILSFGGSLNTSLSMLLLRQAVKRSYGNHHRARLQFQKIPLRIRQQMKATDYDLAEQRCPQKMAIGRLMHEALIELI